MSSYEASMQAAVFADHLSKRPNIWSSLTNLDMIHALFECYEERKPGVTIHRCGRGTCVTRTLKEWVMWIDQPIHVITSHPFPWRELRGPRLSLSSWNAPLVGLRPRFTILDSPFDDDVIGSSIITAKFKQWLREYPEPAFYADQRIY